MVGGMANNTNQSNPNNAAHFFSTEYSKVKYRIPNKKSNPMIVEALLYKGNVDKLNGTKNLPMMVGMTVLFLKNGMIPNTSTGAPDLATTFFLKVKKKMKMPSQAIPKGISRARFLILNLLAVKKK